MDVQPVLGLIAAADGDAGVILVGIGGHGHAGKTTFARMIPGAQHLGRPVDAVGGALRGTRRSGPVSARDR